MKRTMPQTNDPETTLIMGFEGSANKLGIGIVRGNGEILANERKTYITPPGTGFLPNETAQHHRQHIIALARTVLEKAQVSPNELSALAYTMGPGMGGPLVSVGVVVRLLAQLWKLPIMNVNHCIGRML